VNSNNPKLVLREIPFFIYFVGLVFVAFFGFSFFQSRQPIAPVLFAVGLAILIFPSVVTITADRITRTLKLNYRSVMRQSSRQFSFDEIAGIDVQVSVGRRSNQCRVVLKGRDEKLIQFTSYSSSGSKAARLAAKLRDFIGVPGFDASPAGMTYAALESYIAKIHETDGVHWQIQPIGSARWYSSDFRTPGVFLCLVQKFVGSSSTGFMASLGSGIFKKVLAKRFTPDDTPGLDQAANLAPLDAVLEPYFMAFSNSPTTRQIMNPRVSAMLANWAGRFPLKQFEQLSNYGQLTVLFSPNGVYLSPLEPLLPSQVDELAALGAGLIQSQMQSRAQFTSSS
jgi:hypothetical protein